tara:strand:- start:22926 stop:23408 length:483 start_codon:yes stop_codon:yes gene_type:complete
MIIDFDKISDNSRIWIYQSNRDFVSEEIEIINVKTINFLNNWKAHGKELETSFSIIHNRFLIIAVNEEVNPIGGCSIDYSLHLVKDISQSIDLDLLDRLNVNLILDNKIKSLKLVDLKNKIKDRKISPDTIVYNTMINTKKELFSNFKISLSSSWLSKFL